MTRAASGDRHDDVIEAMRAFLERTAPSTTSHALGSLRSRFPDCRLTDRVRACAVWRAGHRKAA